MLPRGCTETLAFGTLLHDIAKPRCRAVTPDGKTTYYGHTEQGAEMGADLMRRLRRSRFVQERVAYLVRYHLRLCMAPRMRPSTLKKMLAEDGFDELLELSRFDALASNGYLGFFHFCRNAMATLTAAEIRPPRLIGGDDLIAMGFKPGPGFKRILAEVEDLHLDGALASRDDAIRYVTDHYPIAAG
jgi:poly(A) polymerase